MDIVKRLRSCDGVVSGDPDCNCAEAADEVERLRAALEPFARADRALGDEPGPFRFETGRGHRLIERDDFRRAAEALK